MNQQELAQLLPHRDHMLLIDEAELIEGKAYGKKYITGEEFFLKGHFPENPIVPVLAEKLAEKFPEITVKISEKHRDHMKFY